MASVVSEFARCSTGGTLAGIRIEGLPRARYVDLDGEGTENDRVLLSVQETARRTGVSTSTIKTRTETGRLEAFRLEGERLVPVADLGCIRNSR